MDLFDHDNVGEPSRKLNLSDEFCMEEFVNFFFDDFMSLFSHLSFLLWYRFGLGANSEFVADYTGMYSRHVIWFPDK